MPKQSYDLLLKKYSKLIFTSCFMLFVLCLKTVLEIIVMLGILFVFLLDLENTSLRSYIKSKLLSFLLFLNA